MFFKRRKRVECAEHGHGEPAFACQRIAAGTALLSFAATDQKSHWPDAWCERCELKRVSGTEEFTCLEQLCHHCYEKAHAAIREGRGPGGKVVFALPYRCGQCDEDHVGLPTWGADAPLAYVQLTPEEREQARLEPDFCEVAEHRFVRSVIEIPVLDSRERFTWGVWSSLSQKNYDFVREHWDDPSIGDVPPMFSWLSTWLPQTVYPSTIHLASQLFFRPGLRPLVVLESTDHPLSVEQVQGMSADRARAISALLLH